MKKWSIPAKTFLLGEYAAIAGAPAIILTTSPCFEVTLSNKPGLYGIHPASPAGKWWLKHGQTSVGLQWYDPYLGHGGVGASSAQFLGAYLASMHIQKKVAEQSHMLDAYLQSAWSGKGLRPSGYDVLAQSQCGCVYINKQQEHFQNFSWPFQDIAFLLLHTGQKLATHHHLQTTALPNNLDQLTTIVELSKTALEQIDSQCMIDAINAYHNQLVQMNLVAEHTMQHIDSFKIQPDILAIKGCGAMGSDVLLLLIPKNLQTELSRELSKKGWNILATSTDLYTGIQLVENNFQNT